MEIPPNPRATSAPRPTLLSSCACPPPSAYFSGTLYMFVAPFACAHRGHCPDASCIIAVAAAVAGALGVVLLQVLQSAHLRRPCESMCADQRSQGPSRGPRPFSSPRKGCQVRTAVTPARPPPLVLSPHSLTLTLSFSSPLLCFLSLTPNLSLHSHHFPVTQGTALFTRSSKDIIQPTASK